MNTCRFCHKMSYEAHKYPLIKYSTRHYAHADCALKSQGAAFFARLTSWQLQQFPALAAHDTGLLDQLRAAIAERPYQSTYRSALEGALQTAGCYVHRGAPISTCGDCCGEVE